MTRTTATNFTAPLQFPYATAGTDVFMKEDVQVLAQAVDQHNHTSGKGLPMAAGSIPNGTITSAMIADGTIATADLANAAVTNAKLGTDTARLNLLTNGGFEVWQRGNGPFSGNVMSADRWAAGLAGTDTLSVSRAAGIAGQAGQYAAVGTFTLGTGGGNSAYYQHLTKADGNALNGKTLSFSVWVNASAGAVRAYIGSDGTGGTTSPSAANTGGIQLLTQTYTVPADFTRVDVGLLLNGSFTIDNAMLVVGSVAADYAPLHPADDLARCLRYYEIHGEAANSMNVTLYGQAGGVMQMPLYYKAMKPVTPTVTKNGTWAVVNCAQPGLSAPGLSECMLFTTITALGQLQFANSGAGQNITIEANP